MASLESTEDLKKGLDAAVTSAQDLLNVTDATLKVIEDMAKVLKKQVAVDFGDATEIAKINKLFEESNKLAEEREKTDKDRKKTKKKLSDLTNEELKLRVKEQKAFKDRKKAVENELALEKKSVKSRENLIAINKALRAEVDKLDITTQGAQIAALNEQIDANTALQLEGADADRKRVKTVGKYTEGIKEALESTSFLGEESKQLRSVLSGLEKIWGKVSTSADDAADSTEELSDKTKKAGKAAKVAQGAFAILTAIFTAISAAFASTRAGGLTTYNIRRNPSRV